MLCIYDIVNSNRKNINEFCKQKKKKKERKTEIENQNPYKLSLTNCLKF